MKDCLGGVLSDRTDEFKPLVWDKIGKGRIRLSTVSSLRGCLVSLFSSVSAIEYSSSSCSISLLIGSGITMKSSFISNSFNLNVFLAVRGALRLQ